MKLVLDIQGKPTAGDAIVYDASAKAWKLVSQASILASTERRIDALREEKDAEIANLEAKIKKLNEQLNAVAKAIA